MARTIEADADDKIAAAAFAPDEGREVALPGAGTRASVVERIVTAQAVAVHRDDSRILTRIRALAAAAGEDWYYRYAVKDHGRVKWIEGPSIKCANNIARLYGNCEIDTRAIDDGPAWMIYARFIDWETGFSMTRPFQQSKAQQTIKTDDEARKQSIAFQIGVSKAIRNVVTNALEQFTTFAFEEAKKNLVEKVGKKLPEYRDKVVATIAELKVDLKRVEAAMGRAVKDWLAGDVAMVIGEIQAIKDGMATIEETWPGDAPPRPTRASVATAAQRVEPFAIVDGNGVEWEISQPGDAADLLLKLLDACGDGDAIEALWETNTLTGQLRERGSIELADKLLDAYAAAHARATPQTATDRNPGGSEKQETRDAGHGGSTSSPAAAAPNTKAEVANGGGGRPPPSSESARAGDRSTDAGPAASSNTAAASGESVSAATRPSASSVGASEPAAAVPAEPRARPKTAAQQQEYGAALVAWGKIAPDADLKRHMAEFNGTIIALRDRFPEWNDKIDLMLEDRRK